MIEEELIKIHDTILNYFLTYKKEYPEFTFLTRMKNNNNRLDKGYLFQGNQDYIFVPLYRIGDAYNKTKTIGFVYTEKKQYIEIVFNKIQGEIDKDIRFHKDLVEYLKQTDKFEVKQKNDKQYFFIFKDNDLISNLNFFLDKFYRKSYELLRKYSLLNRYSIDEETFNKNIKRIEKVKERRKNMSNPIMQELIDNSIKNIILYGVPGVGKTFNHKKLVALIEGNDFSQNDIFDFLINNKDDDIEEGSIDILFDKVQDENRMQFITFHQSFGYEDFIEGFRPNEEGNIGLEDGVFQLICKQAQKNLEDSQKPNEAISQEIKFKKILDIFIEEVENTLEKDNVYSLTENIYIFDVEEDAFRYKGDNWTIHNAGLRMRFDILEKLYIANVKSRKEIKNIDTVGGLAKQHATYFWKLLEKLYVFESKQNIQVDKVEKIERKNYYLIIDEINRGNISKIFGELITLIEEDKRDTLEVTLPYSKKPFKIPSNLYIIGTMNSTDKSIALIDIALRRRFTFLKMKPKADLIDYLPAREIFENLNKKIEEDLGEDYQLGHSYFMKIQNNDDLEFVLEYKIIPLLEEYYYGDDRLIEVIKLCKQDVSIDDNE